MKVKKRLKVMTGAIVLLVLTVFFFVQREVRYMQLYAAQEAWQQQRVDELLEENTGWLNLAGLFWLEEGESSMGSAASNRLVLKDGNAPAVLGSFTRVDDQVSFKRANNTPILIDGVDIGDDEIVLKDDEGGYGDPAILVSGQLQWWIIVRDGLIGVRVRDMDSKHLKNFAGIDRYDFDANWKVQAKFLPFESPRVFEYPTILGTMREEEAPGVLVFEFDGRQFEMVPFERKDGTSLFLVFGDETNGTNTYEGGRFLYVDMPDETGMTYIDFNRAYNPPCAFSAYSTCPQPLRQNRLSLVVDAGEEIYNKPA